MNREHDDFELELIDLDDYETDTYRSKEPALSKKSISDKKSAPIKKRITELKKNESLIDNSKKKGSDELEPTVLQWFNMLMIMQVPVINVFYSIYLILTSKNSKRDYAVAWLLANIVFMTVLITVFIVTLHFTIDIMDSVLEYMEML